MTNKNKPTYPDCRWLNTTALALEEGNRHSPLSISTEAKKMAKIIHYRRQNFVIDGHSSKLLIVAARTADLRKIHLE